MKKNIDITPLGGNKYLAKWGDKDEQSELIDMDGVTIVSDDDLEKLEKAGLDNDTFLSPKNGCGDEIWEAVAQYVVNYSGLDVDEYIEENS